eukprot:CAMPEP_0204865752 /NCGR_PEP_ID=MMETSP1348-20121228/13224_1 /ASSEMBLY_ACC=CAM_ASM_000700 /TAXON_ID=215587 /ORGANISM="Aplanochytrium stocchinoi, Strain GSBS06" /LENGTH=476 /DNA_ID=CAMNT_0052017253 /DNA_START=59 /DNA_END=1489 /DNA_ORIENTATION=+
MENVETVYFVGIEGEGCVPGLEMDPKIEKRTIREPYTKNLPRWMYLLSLPVKIFQQMLQLFLILMFSIGSSEYILVQNPPCIPTFVIVKLVAWLRGIKVIIDWHNLGFSVLALKLGENHPLVLVARIYEKVFAHIGDYHICVTRALKEWLCDSFSLSENKITVMYDKAPGFFHPRNVVEKHRLFYKLSDDLFSNGFGRCPATMYETPFTKATPSASANDEEENRGHYDPYTDDDPTTKFKLALKPDRPRLLISSTSWTPDEDFGILLDALAFLDRRITRDDLVDTFPLIICVVTGKGPQREMYEEKIAQLHLQHIFIRTMWLEAGDYPTLLGSCDLGVCLHTSTSGLDLPMKVVDMFGSGLPVCAVDFQCLPELVKHNVNGKIFKSDVQLADQLFELLSRDENGDNPELSKLREGVKDHNKERWQKQWLKKVKPIFETEIPRPWAMGYPLLFLMVAGLLFGVTKMFPTFSQSLLKR